MNSGLVWKLNRALLVAVVAMLAVLAATSARAQDPTPATPVTDAELRAAVVELTNQTVEIRKTLDWSYHAVCGCLCWSIACTCVCAAKRRG